MVKPVSTFVEPILDVRADFADSCQIGRSGDRWFLLMVDKTTEYVSLYNTKTRSNPLTLLEEYLTFTGRKIRYLRMDNAKEFHSEEMFAFSRDNGIIIHPVITYNHTGMSELIHTSVWLNPMVGLACLMQTCPCVFATMQCWIFVSNGISHGIPKKVLSTTQPHKITFNLRLTTH